MPQDDKAQIIFTLLTAWPKKEGQEILIQLVVAAGLGHFCTLGAMFDGFSSNPKDQVYELMFGPMGFRVDPRLVLGPVLTLSRFSLAEIRKVPLEIDLAKIFGSRKSRATHVDRSRNQVLGASHKWPSPHREVL